LLESWKSGWRARWRAAGRRWADARHLVTFQSEHRSARHGLVVCRAPKRFQLARGIVALPWHEIPAVIEEFLE